MNYSDVVCVCVCVKFGWSRKMFHTTVLKKNTSNSHKKKIYYEKYILVKKTEMFKCLNARFFSRHLQVCTAAFGAIGLFLSFGKLVRCTTFFAHPFFHLFEKVRINVS